MRSTIVSPSATSPAITRRPRRAGRSPSRSRRTAARTPCDDRRVAVDVDVRAHALQLVHVHEAVLEDRLGDAAGRRRSQFSAMNCACMSVGKAGYSLVRKLTALRPPVGAHADPAVARARSSAPASRSLSITASRWSARAPRSSTSPPAAATAHRNVPASMRSGIDACVAAVQLLDALDADPVGAGASMRAPIAISSSPGRRPRARAPRSRAPSRPRPASRPSAGSRCRSRSPCRSRCARPSGARRVRDDVAVLDAISAPSACRPLRCWSTGRAPMAQPPGQRHPRPPKRATSGPSTRIEARIVFTRSYGASGCVTCAASTRHRRRPRARSAATPMWRSRFSIVRMSCRRGTLRSSTGSAVSSAAQRSAARRSWRRRSGARRRGAARRGCGVCPWEGLGCCAARSRSGSGG